MRLAAISAFALLLSADAAFAKCETYRFRLYPETEIETAMSVSSGTRCNFILAAYGQTSLERIAIVLRPKHGTLSTTGTGIAYKSSPGYKGDDLFSFSLSGRIQTQWKSGTVRVRVTVD